MKEVILSWSITKVTSRHATMSLLSGQLWCHCLGFFYRRTWIREAACKSKCWLLWFGPGESCIQKLQLLRCRQYYSMESMNQVCMLALVLSVSQWNTPSIHPWPFFLGTWKRAVFFYEIACPPWWCSASPFPTPRKDPPHPTSPGSEGYAEKRLVHGILVLSMLIRKGEQLGKGCNVPKKNRT